MSADRGNATECAQGFPRAGSQFWRDVKTERTKGLPVWKPHRAIMRGFKEAPIV